MNSNKPDVLQGKEPSKQLAWWIPNIDHRITPGVRTVLEGYSGIAPQDVVRHVYEIRETAWAIRPWPCTGLCGFLAPMLRHIPVYPAILARVNSGGTFVDVGCYCGTDLRSLVLDGCPQDNLYGIDLVNHWDLGFALFQDREKFHVKFIGGDILQPNLEMNALNGKIDVIGATHLLHNWDWQTQVRACCNLSGFSKPGTMIVGFQVGTPDAKRAAWDKEDQESVFKMHTPETFETLWKEVGAATGTQWKSEAVLKEWEEMGYLKQETAYLGESAKLLQFAITRVS